jgi:DNA-binding transcriptional regulator YdaS (Cro superfamily)
MRAMDILTELTPSALARMAGVRPPSVMEWIGRGRIPTDRCPALERGTEGRYTCEQMRPDISWARIPDAQWTWHPQGRPVIDVAAGHADRAAA